MSQLAKAIGEAPPDDAPPADDGKNPAAVLLAV